MEKARPQEKPSAPMVEWKAEFSEEQQRTLREGKINRVVRKELEFLIVEDQDFSRKLLAGMLGVHYRCHLAKNAEEAAALYAGHAPDIAFLDVELPDVDGHMLAALFKKHDPESFIVMVTGNNYVKDVEAAKANKVQGFIVKPYNKLKIMGAVDAFMSKRKKG